MNDRFVELAAVFRLPILKRVQEFVDPALSFEENLLKILESEHQERKLRGIARRTKEAGFPQIKTLDMLKFDRLPKLDKATVYKLATGQYIREKTNVIAHGNAGMGKTHTAIALGVEAINQGYSVRFRKVADLLEQMREARVAHQLTSALKSLTKIDLLILDELCKAIHNSSYGKSFIMQS